MNAGMRGVFFFAIAVGLGLLHAQPLLAQRRVLGSGECVRCHKHSVQAESWQKREPAALGAQAHFNTLDRLRGPRAEELAKQAGLDGPRHARCTACHATVVQGRPRSGVSCESCHGPGSDYLEPHQKPNAYAASVQAGLRDLRVKPENVASLCVSCHLLTDPQLLAAGHPAGERFDAAASLGKIEHWSWDVRQTKLDNAQVGRLARALIAKSAVPARAAQPPRPAAGGSLPPASGAQAQAPAAFDPDAAVALPDDYVEPVAKRRAAAVPDTPLAASLVTRPGATARLAPPAEPPRAAAAAPAGGARATTADVAKARQAAVELLRALLAAGAPAGTPPQPAEYAGPDGELLRLQDEVMALVRKAAEAAARKPR